jgi:hypothetical protein
MDITQVENNLRVVITPIPTGDIWELTVGGGSYYHKLEIPRIRIDIRSSTCAADLVAALSDPRVKFFSAFGHGTGSVVYSSLDPPVIAYRVHNIRQALVDRPPINISITHHCYAAVRNEWAEEFTKGFQPKCFSLATLYPSEGNAYCANALGRAMNTIVENPDMLCYDAYLEALQYFELPRPGDKLVFYGDETTRLSDIIGDSPANG